jgi:hypothetical protein
MIKRLYEQMIKNQAPDAGNCPVLQGGVADYN